MNFLLSISIQLIGIVILIFSNINFLSILPVVVKPIEIIDSMFNEIEQDLIYLNAPPDNLNQLINAIRLASHSTNIDHKLITSLMYTESNFKLKAIGPQNKTNIRYKGLMQTPVASWYSDVDTLHGARILEDKLKFSKHDLKLALALYKGGNNNIAKKQADQVLKIYQDLQTYSNDQTFENDEE